VLSLYSSGTSTSEWRLKSVVNVLLGVHTDHEAWDIHDLSTNTDVSLEDESSGVVDTVRNASLENNGLQPTLQELAEC
jgi:hypothetical protein